MASHRPSRWLAPLALLAAIAAVWLVIQSSTGDSESEKDPTGATTTEQREVSDDGSTTETGTGTTTGPRRKSYRVRPGDTLALIAERTGVSVDELLELNPDIDPNSLTVGEKIKLDE